MHHNIWYVLSVTIPDFVVLRFTIITLILPLRKNFFYYRRKKHFATSDAHFIEIVSHYYGGRGFIEIVSQYVNHFVVSNYIA